MQYRSISQHGVIFRRSLGLENMGNVHKVGPNRSLNRTLHSMPDFGLAFHASPKAGMLFRAG